MLRVYTTPDKRPDFLPYQKQSLDLFLDEPYELVIVNNGSSIELSDKIETFSKFHGLEHHQVTPRNYRNANIACAQSVQFAKDLLIKDGDLSVIIDSDVFLIEPFSIRKYLDGYHIAGYERRFGKVHYLWNALLFFNTLTMPHREVLDLWCGTIEGEPVDVGGHLVHYLRLKEIKARGMTIVNDIHYLPQSIQEPWKDFTFELLNKSFWHYYRGSGWAAEGNDYHQRKSALVFETLTAFFRGDIKMGNWAIIDEPILSEEECQKLPNRTCYIEGQNNRD